MSTGSGGQVLLSSLTAGLTGDQLPQGASLLDLGEHALRDLAQPEQLYQLCHPDLESRFPPLTSMGAFKHNLPVQLSSFIGRQVELAEIKHLLDETRLLTLLGPGGTGKTRLMLQAAAEIIDQYPDGVWLVELAPISNADLFVPQVANSLGVREQPGRNLLEVLLDYLRPKQLLLLIDNVEHMVSECEQLADYLLRYCPNIKILATGRESLYIGGEITFQVPSLALPASTDQSLDEVHDSEAVQLFLSRAQAAIPDFNLTSQNASIVAEIVRRLDGIPLAIELAASRLRMLSVEQIATRLNDLFRLLTGGSRTALPRQQTLQALIDWSWNLLDNNERLLLRRLSVFSGGWILEAAENVAGFDGLDVFNGMEQLVNKSLILVERPQGDQNRYHFLESIRQYARDRLFEAGEGGLLRDRHSGYYTSFILEADHQLAGRDMLVWLDRIRQEMDNFRAALEWSIESNPEQALQISGRLFIARGYRFLPSEGRFWLELSIEKARNLKVKEENIQQHQVDLGVALRTLTSIHFGQGRNEEGVVVGTQAVEILRQAGATRELAYALAIEGFALGFTGQWEEAAEVGQEALDLGLKTNDLWVRSMALATLTQATAFSGDLGRAQVYSQEARSAAKQLGNPWVQAQGFMLEGRLFTQEGSLSRAQASFEQAVQLFEDLRDSLFVLICKSEISHLLRRQGKFELALPIYRETIPNYQELGNYAAVAHQLECFAYLFIHFGKPEHAARLLGAARTVRVQGHTESVVPWEINEYTQALVDLERVLGSGARDAAMTEGSRMTAYEAIAFARGEN